MKLKDLTGKHFGRLTAIKVCGTKPVKWECVCDCGKKKIVSANNLGAHTNSCGCLRKGIPKRKGPRRPHPIIVCATCKKQFTVKPYRAGRARFCSHACKSVAGAKSAGLIMVSRRRSGTKHPYVKCLGRHMHRVVMEKILGRKLRPDEIVHHKDGNGHNNPPENLELTTRSGHARIHRDILRRPRVVSLRKCTWPGCERNQTAKGYCSWHYQKQWRQLKRNC